MEALQDYHKYFIDEIQRRLIEECKDRTLKCLNLLTEKEIWYRPNDESNSVGNLVLHLCGNVKQWLHATIGGEKDTRTRQAEFDERGPVARAVLKQMVIDLMQKSKDILDACTPEDLLRKYSVQGFEENGVGVLIHVTEHFSYHVGQITYFVKAHKSRDVGYYEGLDLNKTD